MTEPKSEKENQGPVVERPLQDPDVPLFLRDKSESQKGDAQDEKDKTAE